MTGKQHNIISESQLRVLKKKNNQLKELVYNFEPQLVVFLSFSASPFQYLRILMSIESVHMNAGNKNSRVLIEKFKSDAKSRSYLEDILKGNHRVLVIDDIIYTGNTKQEVLKLIRHMSPGVEVEYFAFVNASDEFSDESLPFWESEDGVSGTCFMPWKAKTNLGERVNITDREIDPDLPLFTRQIQTNDDNFKQIKNVLNGL